LKRLEEEEFFNELIDMSLAMMERAMQDYQSFADADLKEAARRNVAYFAVALKFLQTPTEALKRGGSKTISPLVGKYGIGFTPSLHSLSAPLMISHLMNTWRLWRKFWALVSMPISLLMRKHCSV